MVQECLQCGQASALHGWTPVLAGPTDWRRFVEASIQPQSGDAGNGLGQRLAAVEPVQSLPRATLRGRRNYYRPPVPGNGGATSVVRQAHHERDCLIICWARSVSFWCGRPRWR